MKEESCEVKKLAAKLMINESPRVHGGSHMMSSRCHGHIRQGKVLYYMSNIICTSRATVEIVISKELGV